MLFVNFIFTIIPTCVIIGFTFLKFHIKTYKSTLASVKKPKHISKNISTVPKNDKIGKRAQLGFFVLFCLVLFCFLFFFYFLHNKRISDLNEKRVNFVIDTIKLSVFVRGD